MMKKSVVGFALALVVGVGGFLPASGASAQQVVCLFGGALPQGQTCPPPARGDFWYLGSWATREVDFSGARLTAFTRLHQNGQYQTSLIYDDGRRIEHWGTYQITMSSNFNQAIRTEPVQATAPEATAIQTGVNQAATVDVSISQVINLFGGAIPSQQTQTQTVASGVIQYFIEGWTPSNYVFSSPQAFTFVTQGDGYVRVTGPGANNMLARRYSLR